MPSLWRRNTKDHEKLYEKAPLGDASKRIRVLTLLPGEPEDGIICTLETQNLSDGPQFEVLSCAWGEDSAIDYKITINDIIVNAICIDQDSKPEREEQVGVMRHIYAAAKRTVVWLGTDDKNSRLIIKACDEMRTSFSPGEVATYFEKAWDSRRNVDDGFHDIELLADRIFHRTYWSKKSVKDTRSQDLGHEVVPALIGLLERGWFSRLWVLQETAVPKDVLVQCGTDTIPLNPLLFYATLLGTVAGHGLMLRQGTKGVADNRWHERVTSFMTLVAAEDSATSGARTLPLPTVLSCFRRFECEEASDKLFALYGLAADDVAGVGIKPDYRVYPEEVYTV